MRAVSLTLARPPAVAAHDLRQDGHPAGASTDGGFLFTDACGGRLDLARSHDNALRWITTFFVVKVRHVPLMACHRPGDPVGGDGVTAGIRHPHSIGKPIRALRQGRLGPNVWHGSLTLTLAQIEELRTRFGTRWSHWNPKNASLRRQPQPALSRTCLHRPLRRGGR